jgi:hypothetical protein
MVVGGRGVAQRARLSAPGRVASRVTPRAFRRSVEQRVALAQERLAAAGIEVEIGVGLTPDARTLVVRCAVLRDGAPDPQAREAAAFAGGYLLRDLADLGARPQRPGNARHLLVTLPQDAAPAAPAAPAATATRVAPAAAVRAA